MSRILLVLIMLAATAGAVVAYGDPEQVARASDKVSHMLRERAPHPPAPCRSRAARTASSRCTPRSTASPRRW